MQVTRVPIRVHPQPEGGFVVTSPVVPELLTEADTWAEVWSNLADAWEAVVELYEEQGRVLPVTSDSSDPIDVEALIPA